MKKRLICMLWTACILMAVTGCGPDNIFLKHGLDTPAQHVDNGNRFLESGKLDAAFGEFSRAIELDPRYSPAYVGLGIVYGRRGEPKTALETMQKARELARDPEQHVLVDQGVATLEGMGIID